MQRSVWLLGCAVRRLRAGEGLRTAPHVRTYTPLAPPLHTHARPRVCAFHTTGMHSFIHSFIDHNTTNTAHHSQFTHHSISHCNAHVLYPQYPCGQTCMSSLASPRMLICAKSRLPTMLYGSCADHLMFFYTYACTHD
jgi:hypothetical protein